MVKLLETTQYQQKYVMLLNNIDRMSSNKLVLKTSSQKDFEI